MPDGHGGGRKVIAGPLHALLLEECQWCGMSVLFEQTAQVYRVYLTGPRDRFDIVQFFGMVEYVLPGLLIGLPRPVVPVMSLVILLSDQVQQ